MQVHITLSTVHDDHTCLNHPITSGDRSKKAAGEDPLWELYLCPTSGDAVVDGGDDQPIDAQFIEEKQPPESERSRSEGLLGNHMPQICPL